MIGDAYYIIGLTVLIMSFSNLINYYEFFENRLWIQSFRKISGSYPLSKDFRSKEKYTIYSIFNTFTTLEFCWLVLGLITKSWLIFLILISFHFIIRKLFNTNFILMSKYLGLLFHIIKPISIFFLIINHFHLHINLINLL